MHHSRPFSGTCALRMLWAVLLITCVNQLYAQRSFTLYADSLDKNIELSFVFANWYFHPGDLQQPVTGTQGWDALSTTSFGKSNAPQGWNGFGWFGLWLKADLKAVNKKIDLRIDHDGASEIFLDGKPVGGFGKIGLSGKTTVGARYPRELVPLWLGDTLPHLLTIRYANFSGVHPDFVGFETYIGDYRSVHTMLSRSSNFRSFMPMCAAAQWMLALMHLLLFLFYPRQKLNVYFATYAAIMGIIVMASYLFYETHNPQIQYYAEYAGNECMPLLMWFGGLLLYNIGYGYIPAWKKAMLAVISGLYFTGFLAMALWHSHLWEWHLKYHFDFVSLLFLVFFLFFCDELWGIFRAIRRGKPGLWLIGVGVLSAIVAIGCTWLDIFSMWSARQNGLRLFTMSAGTLVFPICVSLYLALDFARTNKSLTARLEEVKTLSKRALEQQAEKRELLETEARRLEATVQERTAELQQQTNKLHEMDRVKSRFFTNITHEFKTPLTLISNPAQELLAMNKDITVQYHAELIRKNAERLLQLINQLLDLSKLESGLMHLAQSPLEIIAELKKQIGNYGSLTKQKAIELVFTSSLNELWVLSDHDKLEKITTNLLSNAIKFTDKGRVEIALKKDDATFTLSVKDTGKGIPTARLPYIFERFYQADPSDIRSAEGTGIGLALTKELVALMGGHISAESIEHQYTLIEVTLPLQPALPAQQNNNAALPQLPAKVSVINDTEQMPVDDRDSNLVLVIEDNDELRDFISRSLAGRFRVMDAPDGKNGIAIALKNIPDIIITDIMMPGMDGYEVCALLKADERTSHIPVVMLTARSGTESRIKGIETGTDAYIGKPFVQKELLAVMENLIKTRRLLQEKYSRSSIAFLKTEVLPSLERQFLDRVQSAIHNHLDDERFGADQLAAEIGLSRTQLHRKLKALLDKSPGDFIRSIRLEHAHQLLRERIATVSEVAYRVGFGSPASFSASFSRHFGFPPSEVSRKNP